MIYYLPILFQALFIIHVIKKEKDRFWIYILLFIPLAGGIAYFVVEMLPDITRGQSLRGFRDNLINILNPDGEVKNLERVAAHSPTYENLKLLGEEYLKRQKFTEAIEIFHKCLQGPHANDSYTLFRMAESYFGVKEFSAAEKVLGEIYKLKKEKTPPEVLLYYAETKIKLEDISGAENVFQTLLRQASDLRYQYEYGRFLRGNGDQERANEIFKQILFTFESLPDWARKTNRQWMKLAKQEMGR